MNKPSVTTKSEKDLLEFIIKISKLINDNSSGIKKIQLTLNELCLFFNLQKGFIYQLNRGEFILKDTFGNNDLSLKEKFKISDISFKQKKYFFQNNFFRIHKEMELKPVEKSILNLFHMDSLVMHRILDDDNKIIGFIGIGNGKDKLPFSSQERDTIIHVLDMISKEMTFYEHRRRESLASETLRNIMDHVGVQIYVVDYETQQMLYANKPVFEHFNNKSYKNKRCWEYFFNDKDRRCDYCPVDKLTDENDNPTGTHIWENLHPNGGPFFRVYSTAFSWVDGRLAHVLAFMDVSENKKNEETIKYMLKHDDLTDLPNRRKLIEDLEAFMSDQTPKNDQQAYLMFMDLDNFKNINDTFGHSSGNELLIKIAKYLQNIEGLEGRIYRQSGDEFIIFMPQADKEKVIDIVKKIKDRSDNPWTLENGVATCSASIGIAHYPTNASNSETLIQAADTAMYTIKRQGKKGHYFANTDFNE